MTPLQIRELLIDAAGSAREAEIYHNPDKTRAAALNARIKLQTVLQDPTFIEWSLGDKNGNWKK